MGVCAKDLKAKFVSDCACQVTVCGFYNDAVSRRNNFRDNLSGNIFCKFAE